MSFYEKSCGRFFFTKITFLKTHFIAIRIDTLLQMYSAFPNYQNLKMTQIDHVKIEEYKQSLESKHCETLEEIKLWLQKMGYSDGEFKIGQLCPLPVWFKFSEVNNTLSFAVDTSKYRTLLFKYYFYVF